MFRLRNKLKTRPEHDPRSRKLHPTCLSFEKFVVFLLLVREVRFQFAPRSRTERIALVRCAPRSREKRTGSVLFASRSRQERIALVRCAPRSREKRTGSVLFASRSRTERIALVRFASRSRRRRIALVSFASRSRSLTSIRFSLEKRVHNPFFVRGIS